MFPTQRVPLPVGCLVISVACWVVIRVFPIILLILQHKIKWFLLIFWVFSEKTDAGILARITMKVLKIVYRKTAGIRKSRPLKGQEKSAADRPGNMVFCVS